MQRRRGTPRGVVGEGGVSGGVDARAAAGAGAAVAAAAAAATRGEEVEEGEEVGKVEVEVEEEEEESDVVDRAGEGADESLGMVKMFC